MLIRVKRGLEANRLSLTPEVGEPLFTTDTKRLYIGDGVTPGGIEVDMNGAGIAPVQSVSGKTGHVMLIKSDVGLSNVDNTSDANKPISVAVQAALDLKATTASTASHTSNVNNPHSVTKAQVGLPNVDDVSAASLRDRSTHTGTQAINTIAGLDASLAGKQPVGSYATTDQFTDGLAGKQDVLASGANIKTVNGSSLLGSGNVTISGGAVDSVNGATGVVTLNADDISDALTVKKFTTAAEKTKLGGIAVGATANDSDANLKDRANHTGTQLASTISDLDKSSVGLSNVDNTSDANKPISVAVQAALDSKATDSAVVHKTGAETVAGVKTFTSNVLVNSVAAFSPPLTSSSGLDTGLKITAAINETGTAGYELLRVDATVGTIGSGAKYLANFLLGGVQKAYITSIGNMRLVGGTLSFGSGGRAILQNASTGGIGFRTWSGATDVDSLVVGQDGRITSAVAQDSAANTMLVTNHTQTITNKTISGASNTLSDIPNTALATDPLARVNHTGTQAMETVAGLESAMANKVDRSFAIMMAMIL